MEKPWARAKTVSEIPSPATEQALEEMPADEYARMIRDHLLPRPELRAQWIQLWDLIYIDEVLAERTLDVLEAFLVQVSDLRADPNAPAAELRRADRFERQVKEAWARIETKGKLRPPAALRRLARAVARHRSFAEKSGKPTWYDDDLWNTMVLLGLDDPARDPRRH